MRVLVTGVAGFIGSHVAEALTARGDEVVGADCFIPNYPRSFKERNLTMLRGRAGFEFHEVDLRRADLAPLLDGVDAVINEAAMPGLLPSWTDLDLYAGCNLIAVGRLADACVERGIGRFVHISTSSVYGADAVGDESMATVPVSPYGVTKLAGDMLLLAQRRRVGLPVSILRYFSVYGPRQRPDMGYHLFIEAMLDDRPITVYGDGSQSRSVTFISDCVAATLAALERAGAGEIYNIGGGAEITVAEAIDLISQSIGRRPRLVYAAERAGDQARTHADTAKARRALGWQPTVLPEEGLRTQVEWHMSLRD